MGDIVEKAGKATPPETLERQIMDPNVPKNEREWWAATTISNLQAVLNKIAECDYPRPIGKYWRADCKPSKNDQCVHGQFMYESCDNCCSDFARQALEAHHGQ